MFSTAWLITENHEWCIKWTHTDASNSVGKSNYDEVVKRIMCMTYYRILQGTKMKKGGNRIVNYFRSAANAIITVDILVIEWTSLQSIGKSRYIRCKYVYGYIDIIRLLRPSFHKIGKKSKQPVGWTSTN